MSRRKKKAPQPSTGQSDELGQVMQEESGVSLPDLDRDTVSRPNDDEDVESDDGSDQHDNQDQSQEAVETQPQPPDGLPDDTMPVHPPSTEGVEGVDEDLLGMAEEYGRETSFHRIVPAVIGIAVALALVGVIGGGIILSRLLDAKNQSESVQLAFTSIQESMTNLDFRTALTEFPKGHEAIVKLEHTVADFQFARGLPWIGSSVSQTYRALAILDRMFTSVGQLLDIVNSIGTVIFRTNGEKTFELYMKTLSIDEKGKILKMITQALPTIQGVKASLQLAIHESNELDQDKLSSKLRDGLAAARAGAGQIQSMIDAWMPLAEVMPSFLGYPQEKVYLILLQDTSELRATGGFISHYGILKMHNGEITYLRTDNVYNLDDQGESRVSLPSPAPIQKYFSRNIKKWLFRDANWSPDFREAAQQAERLYALEGGSGHIDGVLAATPELVRSLLRFSGPVRIEGRDYDADNFLEQLAFEVREGNYRRGISEKDRKEIFGQLIARMGDRLLAIPLTRWLELYKIIESRLNEKHLLLYFHDPVLQAFASEKHWTGEIAPKENSDFLMVVDSTLGTLKTESVMDKRVRYTVREDPDGFLVGHVELTYTNNGVSSDVTTRYRDWVRILVPKGSTLVSSSGAQQSDDQSKQGTLETTEGSDTMQFGAYVSVEPRYTKVFTLEYRLPDTLYERMKRDRAYSLVVQKQPGNTHTQFQGNLMFRSPIKEYAPLGFFNARRAPGALDVYSDLRTDQEFTVTFPPEDEK